MVVFGGAVSYRSDDMNKVGNDVCHHLYVMMHQKDFSDCPRPSTSFCGCSESRKVRFHKAE